MKFSPIVLPQQQQQQYQNNTNVKSEIHKYSRPNRNWFVVFSFCFPFKLNEIRTFVSLRHFTPQIVHLLRQFRSIHTNRTSATKKSRMKKKNTNAIHNRISTSNLNVCLCVNYWIDSWKKKYYFCFFFSFVVRSFILGEKNVHWLVNVLDCLYKAKATIALRGVSYRCICHLESHRKHESTSKTEIQNKLNEQMFYWLTDLCELNIISKKKKYFWYQNQIANHSGTVDCFHFHMILFFSHTLKGSWA